MSILETTISLMKELPEIEQKKVLLYVQNVVSSQKNEDYYKPVSKSEILNDLAISDQEYLDGKAQDFEEAIMHMRREHIFSKDIGIV